MICLEHNVFSNVTAGDKKTSRKILGGLGVFILALLLLPVGSIISIVIRLVFLYFLVTASVVVPLRRRLPLLMPGLKKTIKTYLTQFIEKVFIPFRNKYYKMVSKIRESSATEGGMKKEEKLSTEDWQRVCKEIGVKTTFSKGESIGVVGETSDTIYRLVSGQVVIKSDNGVDVTAAAPATLLSTNVIIGHGRQGEQRLFFHVFCILTPAFRSSRTRDRCSKVLCYLCLEQERFSFLHGVSPSFCQKVLDQHGR